MDCWICGARSGGIGRAFGGGAEKRRRREDAVKSEVVQITGIHRPIWELEGIRSAGRVTHAEQDRRASAVGAYGGVAGSVRLKIEGDFAVVPEGVGARPDGDILQRLSDVAVEMPRAGDKR